MRTGFRLVVLFALLVITALPAAAGPRLGNNPRAAVPLSGGLNVGTLESGEGFWYAFSNAELSDQPARAVVLNMVYRPGGHDVAAYVNFKVLVLDQVDRWLQGYTDEFTGIGTFTTTDFDQETAERLWSGNLLDGETYYVYLFNNSTITVEYHLTALGRSEGTGCVPGSFVSPVSSTTPVSVRASGESLKPGPTLEETQWLLVAAAVQGMSTGDAATWLMLANQMGWLPGSGAADGATLPTYAQSDYVSPERAAATEVVETPREAVEETAEVESVPSLLDTPMSTPLPRWLCRTA